MSVTWTTLRRAPRRTGRAPYPGPVSETTARAATEPPVQDRVDAPVDEQVDGQVDEQVDEQMVLSRVVVDLDEVDAIEGAGLDFIVGLHRRWKVRLLNTPNQLRGRIPRMASAAATD